MGQTNEHGHYSLQQKFELLKSQNALPAGISSVCSLSPADAYQLNNSFGVMAANIGHDPLIKMMADLDGVEGNAPTETPVDTNTETATESTSLSGDGSSDAVPETEAPSTVDETAAEATTDAVEPDFNN